MVTYGKRGMAAGRHPPKATLSLLAIGFIDVYLC